MNIFKNLFFFKENSENNIEFSNKVLDHYEEISKIVKEARIQQNLSIKELSKISKIPEQTINSIENNIANIRPILIKLEECLVLKKNTLIKLAIREIETLNKEKKDFLVRKFDLINTWYGSLLYFFILVVTIFVLKRYFILNVNLIEIQNIENKIIDK